MRRVGLFEASLLVGALSVLLVPNLAVSRPASTTVAPAKTAKPGHGKKPSVEAPAVVVEPWSQSPRYGAPWKPSPGPLSATSKGSSQRVTGSAFEFFFWVFAALIAFAAGTAVTARVRQTRLAPWEARSEADATPSPRTEASAPTR